MNFNARAFFAAAVLWAVFSTSARAETVIRVATFNASLQRDAAGKLLADLNSGSPQAAKIAAVIQTVRPDVVLLNEFDYDKDGEALEVFREKFLAVPQGEYSPIAFRFAFVAAVNTGEPTGLDLNGDGASDGPADAYGFGRHPGQYGMVVLSQFPIHSGQVRTFRKFLWRDMPAARLPKDPATGEMFYSEAALARLRLPSKSVWDVPIQTPSGAVHLIASHPTPPVFDNDADYNGLRNADEIRLVADYVDARRSEYIYDDAGVRGGLAAGEPFVIAGDLNADPADGESTGRPILQLLRHRRIRATPIPSSTGGVAAGLSGVANRRQLGNPSFDTGKFGPQVGNLRIDYVLPSTELRIVKSGVFWPEPGEPGAELLDATDHRLVWCDL
ncbi:MAG: endonuclease/exonuclease/phosphatase family protein, partial [Pirellulaceae bacterium]|nr:endonuclease/exonuclease/phosphatase family protein [Pirellulaceae bacterium]